MDPVLLSGLIGAVGSVTGTIFGTVLGYRLANSRADISVFANYRITVYYLKSQFCAYLPITITNGGNKGGAVYDLQAKLKSHNGQEWRLGWGCFAKEDPTLDYAWIDGDRASPIYIHGNSGVQHTLKFFATDDSTEEKSNVVMSPGKFHLIVEYREKSKPKFVTQSYSFMIDSAISEALEARRQDPSNNGTLLFDLQEGGKGEAIA